MMSVISQQHYSSVPLSFQTAVFFGSPHLDEKGSRSSSAYYHPNFFAISGSFHEQILFPFS